MLVDQATERALCRRCDVVATLYRGDQRICWCCGQDDRLAPAVGSPVIPGAMRGGCG